MMNFQDLVELLGEVSDGIVKRWSADRGWSNDPLQVGVLRHSDVWSTAEGVLWLLAYDPEHHEAEIVDGLTYLVNTQRLEGNVDLNDADGGWGSKLDQRSEATATSLALLALVRYTQYALLNKPAAVAQVYYPNISAGRDWLVDNVDTHGGWSLLHHSYSSAFNTCWGCIALAECNELPGLRDPRIAAGVIPGALGLVWKSRRNGGWGDILDRPADPVGTAYCTYLLLYTQNGQKATYGMQWLHTHQSPTGDGNWEPALGQSPIEATAWATIALLAGGTKPQSPTIEQAIWYLRSAYIPSIGWPPSPGSSAEFWTTFYSALALVHYRDALRGSMLLPHSSTGKRVFIVHGHNYLLRDEVYKSLQKQGLEPIVLERSPQHSRTIIESIERYARQGGADYAIVLATADDDPAGDSALMRSNVGIELGAFLVGLGRERVSVLTDGQVDLGSDLAGIRYIDVRKGDWENMLIGNLRNAKLL